MFSSLRRFIYLLYFPARTLSDRVSSCTWTRYVQTHHPFDEMLHTELSALNYLIASHVRNRDALAAWNLFYRMHSTRSDLDAYTFTPVLGTCSLLPECEPGKQVHALIIKKGVDSATVTKTALMNMYSKYGHLGDSVRVFQEIQFKDVVTWNALLSNFLKHGLAHEALQAFQAMRRADLELSLFTLCSVLKTCASLKAIRQGKQVHGLVVLTGCDLVILGTALIDFYSSFGLIDEALKVYSSLSCRKDDAMHNSLISGCIRNKRYEEAFSIMFKMKPNVIALTSALSACSDNSDLWIGKQIHCVAIRRGFTSETQLCNTLLDMYAKCGKVLHARLLFDGIPNKSVVSWTSMVDAYGSHGYGLEAVELFKKMNEGVVGVLPNSVTFLAVLSACGHSGLVEQGRECFQFVRANYGLEPGPEHYACFIDILGRAGRMEEVMGLYNEMIKQGTRPNEAVCVALMNACMCNHDVQRGEFAATHLLQLGPNQASSYVLVSNYYAAIERWDLVDDLRNFMRKKGLAKQSGNSWITALSRHEDDIRLFA